ncbi:MAG: SDR family NAD(P)-dependent oxidoreductase, partial [Anaerolineae bacterium]|nr:SDR family NAD(P)-dependent oxidoreductase [Anaerolineae bacterium]
VGGGVDETHVYNSPSSTGLWCYARLRPDEPGQDENILIGDVAVFDESGTLISETLGARLWYLDHDSPQSAENVDDWFYGVEWQPQDTPTPELDASGSWLILGDTDGVGDEFAGLLETLGGRGVLMFANADDELSDYLQAMPDCRGIIHLRSLDAPASEGLMIADLDRALDLGTATALHIVQALARINWMHPPRIWLVTRGAQPVATEDDIQVAQSPIWGFGRTLALEYSEYWGGLIDLDPHTPTQTAAQQLWQAIAATTTGDDHQAFRGEQRFAARLVRQRMETLSTFRPRPDGSYLITGGLGGLGLTIAHWLAENGSRRLILMGRTPLPPRLEWAQIGPESRAARQIAGIRSLEAMGVSVHIAAVDASDEDQLRAFLNTYKAEGWPPIRGVVHAAGVMQYQSMLEHTADEMRQIFQPKVAGSWLLHSLLPDLDFFVLFSSVSALLSSPLIGSYAAANTFLDALAHYRRAKGLPALSIDWGAWGEVGMVADFGRVEESTDTLMQPMSTEGALDAFGRVLRQPEPQIAIMAANWKRWEKLFSALNQPPFLSAVMGGDSSEVVAEASQNGFNLQTLLEAGEAERAVLVEGFLVDQVSRVLGFASDRLNTAESLSNLGMDSLMAVELKNRIEANLRLVVPMTQLLQGPSVNQLTNTLVEQLAGQTIVERAEDNWEEGAL